MSIVTLRDNDPDVSPHGKALQKQVNPRAMN
jgi:hypothetical protein